VRIANRTTVRRVGDSCLWRDRCQSPIGAKLTDREKRVKNPLA
jgi:hypothetical protein